MSYAWLILEELKSNSPNFGTLCMPEIQRITQSRNKGHRHEKERNLCSVESDGMFEGKCRNCGKICGYRSKECKKCKGMANHVMVKGAIPTMVALIRHVTFASLKGIMNHNIAPEW
jgi:hypothetical protein